MALQSMSIISILYDVVQNREAGETGGVGYKERTKEKGGIERAT